RAVDVQEADAASILNACRQFLAWRSHYSALQTGKIRFVPAPEDTLAFVRENEGERILALFNLSGKAVTYQSEQSLTELEGHGFTQDCSDERVALPPYGAFFGILGSP
ncbi:MAG TPA: alpha-glucosidase C-terminal domain-containing protein, partial [Terrimicrobiaceae bacterium]